MGVYLGNERKFEMKERKKEKKKERKRRRGWSAGGHRRRRPGGGSAAVGGAGRARASPKGREVVLGGFLLEELWLMFWWRW